MSVYDNLNPPQKEAVLCTEGPLLILAGAGSGKTRVLTHRIAYLISEKGVNPWNILAITFTNKAAQEMRERVNNLVGEGAESIWVSTFHSACVRILRRHIDFLGYDNHFAIYDTDDQKNVMKEVYRKLEIDTKLFKERAVLAEISHAKEKLISPADMEKEAGRDRTALVVANAYREYEQILRKNNALDFDDLIARTAELFEKHPQVLEYYQERFRYILVDEYQDTNYAQFRFVSLLASKYRNLCVVGDDDQSIYRFRGADIQNILGFEHDFPDTRIIRLEQNYRSTKNILQCANMVIANNEKRKTKTLWTENEEGEKIHFRQFMNGFEEAEYVVGEVQAAVRTGEAKYKDYAVLYRTNAQSRMFEEKLLAAGIPYKIVGAVNFYARREIKDLLAYMRTVDNSVDDLSVRRILNVPRRGIGDRTQEVLQDYADEYGISFYDALCQIDEIPTLKRSAGKIGSFVSMIRMLKTKAEDCSVRELLEEIISVTGYRDELEKEGTEESESRLENIDELISTAQSFMDAAKEEGREATLSAFLEEIALVSDIDTVDPGQDYMLLMTLHSAKGLEFPRVFMTGMEDGVFPGYGTIMSGTQADMEEERRLCYVGMTRAMKQLTLTAARQRMIRGDVQFNKTSRFIHEMPREIVDLGHTVRETSGSVKESMKARSGLPFASSKPSRGFSDTAPGIYRNNPYTHVPKPAKQFQVTAAAKPDYQEGDRVVHMKFGTGVVKSIVSGGRDYEVTVDFDRAGIKKMFAAFAKLKKI